jgi:hypothetical protein
MNIPARACLLGALLAAVLTAHAETEPKAWAPSDATMEQVNGLLKTYEKCANDETRAHLDDKMDSRKVTDVILQKCEDKLSAIKTVFNADHAPDAASEHFIRRKRSHVAQQILRVVMGHQAVQSTNQTP